MKTIKLLNVILGISILLILFSFTLSMYFDSEFSRENDIEDGYYRMQRVEGRYYIANSEGDKVEIKKDKWERLNHFDLASQISFLLAIFGMLVFSITNILKKRIVKKSNRDRIYS